MLSSTTLALQTIALVSDAGTPGISDPGLALAAECVAKGYSVVPVPGACAAIAAISISALDAREFTFFGFLPRGGKSRRQKLLEIAAEQRSCVLYEAPHRIVSTLNGLVDAGAGKRLCVCAREVHACYKNHINTNHHLYRSPISCDVQLTKRYEESYRGELQNAALWFESVVEREGRVRGEFTVVLGPMDESTLHSKKLQAKEAEAERVCASVCLGKRLVSHHPFYALPGESAAQGSVQSGRVGLSRRQTGRFNVGSS